MAAVPSTSYNQRGDFVVSKITLGASDTLTYVAGREQILVLNNPTVGSVTVTIDGSTASNAVPIPGTGGVFDASSGKSITVAAGATKAVRLSSIDAYLQGTIAVTGGTGLEAYILASA